MLTKNESYWDAENVRLTQVTLISIDEVSTQNTMFKNGELAAIVPGSTWVDVCKLPE